jgi:hypothetical protein
VTHSTAPDVALAEYQALKAEQVARIGIRDNLIYAVLAAAGAIAAAVATAGNVRLLLALPPAALVLGWTYLQNDRKISAIGAYLRDGELPLRWETAHRATADRRRTKHWQLAIDLTAFCGPGAAALTIVTAAHALHGSVIALAGTELLAVLALGSEFAHTARTARTAREHTR